MKRTTIFLAHRDKKFAQELAIFFPQHQLIIYPRGADTGKDLEAIIDILQQGATPAAAIIRLTRITDIVMEQMMRLLQFSKVRRCPIIYIIPLGMHQQDLEAYPQIMNLRILREESKKTVADLTLIDIEQFTKIE